MFKISYLVDDKRLPDMLRACAGHVYSLDVVPVANAELPVKAAPKPTAPKLLAGPKKAVEVSPGPRNFIQELEWSKGFQFRGGDIAKRCPALGLRVESRWYVITHELKNKRIKRVESGLYEVC